jgi:hypothetical protein
LAITSNPRAAAARDHEHAGEVSTIRADPRRSSSRRRARSAITLCRPTPIAITSPAQTPPLLKLDAGAPLANSADRRCELPPRSARAMIAGATGTRGDGSSTPAAR